MPKRPVPAPWMYTQHPDWARRAGVANDSSGIGDYGPYITLREMMETYDRLPKAIQDALRNANLPWAPSWAAEVFFYDGYSEDEIVERLRRADREEAQKRRVQLLRRKG